MQSRRMYKVALRIESEKKEVHYWSDEREGESLDSLRQHLNSDYINIDVYHPPSPRLIQAFPQLLKKNQNIKYI